MNRIVLALLILCLAAIACGSSTPQLKTADDYVKEYGGKIDVYNRILTSTDCDQLQKEFDQAESNLGLQEPGTPQYKWGLGYMAASNNRMKEIGCYGTSESSVVNTPAATSVSVQITIVEGSPTSYILPTLTPPPGNVIYISPTPVNTIIVILPTTQHSNTGICPCTSDSLNCGDFSSNSDAQACMEHCINIGAGDIHNLDGNANGQACENN